MSESPSGDLSSSARRVQEFLDAHGVALKVLELPASTRTAVDAAQAVGCDVAQIVKSLIFRGRQSGKPVLVLASGANRVDTALIAPLAGEPIGKADADFVRQETGFAIGGIPPVGLGPMTTIMDADLEAHAEIWAAAGTPHALFRLTPDELRALARPVVARIA